MNSCRHLTLLLRNQPKMPVHTITLELPFGFVPDPVLYTATPELCAIVLTTGCVALKALLNKTDSHSYEEAYEKATAQQFDKWITEKCQLEKELRTLKNQIKEMEENDKVPLLCETWYESESDTVMREHDHNLSTQREINHEAEQLIKESEERKFNIESIEKALSEAAIQAEKDKFVTIEKVREELNKKIEKQEERMSPTDCQSTNSSQNGQDSEKFTQLLDSVFGFTSVYLRKKKYSVHYGDHIIIHWEELKLMFVIQNFGKRVHPDQVDEAMEDFAKHAECDVLIFVSETSSIVKHERPGHLDIDTVDGRSAIWIGEFNRNENKVVYMQMIAQVIRQLARLQKRVKELGGDDDVEGDCNKHYPTPFPSYCTKC